jgi:16S rRNA (adenine1518-N6/adenine1519-N6)-dimethyltransferase
VAAVVTEAAGQRRKMLRQSLKTLGVDTAALLSDARIEPTARAEEIAVAGFVRLANIFSGQAKSRL